jgi:hypothetical protein
VTALAGWLGRHARPAIPDTPAIELIVPSLVASLNAQLERLAGWPAGARLHLPAGLDDTLLNAVRARLAAASDLPAKLLHSLEVVGHAAAGAPIRTGVPVGAGEPGMVGASPAATAAWLGDRARPEHPSARFLAGVVRRYGGPVPSVLPITMFERAWVVGGLLTAGVDVPVPEPLVREFADAVAESGTPGGAGLPPDADTTGMVLYTLGRLGRPVNLDCLWEFEADGHFCTWPGERTPSTTTNAHVLDACRAALAGGSGPNGRAWAAVDMISSWLCEHQLPDGSWTDKWHASPYYATACCALSLRGQDGPGPAAAVQRALRFLVDSQRPDGSWGRWAGTAEETAYALHVLLTAGRRDEAATDAAARGYAYLLDTAHLEPDPPLWHDKDLYAPTAVVRTAVLVALHLGQNRRDIVTRTG